MHYRINMHYKNYYVLKNLMHCIYVNLLKYAKQKFQYSIKLWLFNDQAILK